MVLWPSRMRRIPERRTYEFLLFDNDVLDAATDFDIRHASLVRSMIPPNSCQTSVRESYSYPATCKETWHHSSSLPTSRPAASPFFGVFWRSVSNSRRFSAATA